MKSAALTSDRCVLLRLSRPHLVPNGVELAVQVPLDGESFGVVDNPGVPVLKDLAELVANVRLRLDADVAFLPVGVFVLPDDAAIATPVDGAHAFRPPFGHLSSDELLDRVSRPCGRAGGLRCLS